METYPLPEAFATNPRKHGKPAENWRLPPPPPPSLRPSSASPGAAALPKEAAALWASFDRLAASDPAEYDRVTARLMAEAAADRSPPAPPPGYTPTPGFCVWALLRALLPPLLTAPAAAAPRPPRLPRPPWLQVGARVYVNVCSHAAIEPPTTEDGKPAPPRGGALSLRDLFNLNIPLIVAPARRVTEGGGGEGAAAAAAVDVLCHPWVLEACAREPAFRKEYVAFALRAVADEFCLQLGEDWVEGARGGAKYRGGAPEDGTPVPYVPPSRAPATAAEALGVGRRQGSGGGGARRSSGADDLLARVAAAANEGGAAGGGSEEGGGNSAATGLLDVGRALAAALPAPPLPGRAAPKDAEAVAASAAAAGLAQFAAQSLPAAALLYSDAVARSGVAAAPADGSGGDSGGGATITATIVLSPQHAATGEPGFLGSAQLDVESEQITLRLPPHLLPQYNGLSLPAVPVAVLRLPPGLRCAPDTARARFSKKLHTLTITMQRA